jgi:hypothetical protein
VDVESRDSLNDDIDVDLRTVELAPLAGSLDY